MPPSKLKSLAPKSSASSPLLRDLGENALLRRILPLLPPGRHVRTGPGDDCAVAALPGSPTDLLYTTDAVIERRHFPAWRDCAPSGVTPALIGRKALARTLSDIAAMGGTPLHALVDLVAPADLPVPFAIGLFRGMRTLALEHSVGIIGGDTAEGPALELHVTAVGTVPRGRAILRSTARPDDMIYVTGRLGASWRPGNKKQYTFPPRLAEGRFLLSWATSMMDLSDGLGADLPRLLDASNVGAEIDINSLPLSPAARRTPDPIQSAWSDGEDFELLFTVPARKCRAFDTAWRRAFPRLPATPIGHILPDPETRPLPPGGWQHFHS